MSDKKSSDSFSPFSHGLTSDVFDPFASEAVTGPYSKHWEAKRRVAAAVRALTDALVTSTPDDEDLNRLADGLEQHVQAIASAPRLYGLRQFVETGHHGGHGEINHELNAVGGWSNPLSPGLNMWIEGNKAFGSVRCGYAYEGPPDHVHGGFIAAILDQFLGMAQLAGGNPGMTGTLEVRYHKPTPLNVDLSLEATIEPVEGRKTIVSGTVSANGVLTATGTGVFIRPTRPIAKSAPKA